VVLPAFGVVEYAPKGTFAPRLFGVRISLTAIVCSICFFVYTACSALTAPRFPVKGVGETLLFAVLLFVGVGRRTRVIDPASLPDLSPARP
jgi:hypothetical protein